MNAELEPVPVASFALLDLVDFKWLMSGLGWWVDTRRMQSDPKYAAECLRRGLAK